MKIFQTNKDLCCIEPGNKEQFTPSSWRLHLAKVNYPNHRAWKDFIRSPPEDSDNEGTNEEHQLGGTGSLKNISGTQESTVKLVIKIIQFIHIGESPDLHQSMNIIIICWILNQIEHETITISSMKRNLSSKAGKVVGA